MGAIYFWMNCNSATYIENIDISTRVFIGLLYMTTLTVTLILTYIRI